MTREERRAETRARILEAAGEVFAQRGFHGATVEEITERAGYTRGAFYSNFDDKDELFLALLDQRLAIDITEIGAILENAESPVDAFAALRSHSEQHGGPDKHWIMLSTEFWLYAMRNPSVRPKLAQHQRAERQAFGKAIAAQFEAVGFDVPAPLAQLALLIQIVDHGVLREHFIAPEEVPEGSFFEILSTLFEAGVALAGARSSDQVEAR